MWFIHSLFLVITSLLIVVSFYIKGHFETITRHKLLVMKYCFECGLYEQGLAHDLSKYSPTEFIPGRHCRF